MHIIYLKIKMKHHRKTVGKHCQKKNGMRKTMKGGDWTNPFTWKLSFTSDSTTSDSTTSDTTTPDTTTDTTTPSKTFFSFLPSLSSFLSSSKTAETPPPPPPPPQVDNNNTGTGGYMGGKRKGKTAKKNCPKKGGGK
jgi:hypothetical protein